MIALDTNVVSELMRPEPDAGVARWVDEVPGDDLVLTAVALAELRYGIERLPGGRRRVRLSEAVAAMVEQLFGGRVLAFDRSAAVRYGELMAGREGAGKPMGIGDAQIAAICGVSGATLATRNGRDFVGTGIELIDPWAHR